MLGFFSKKSVFVFFCLFFRLLLDVSYVTFVSPVFEYSGFYLNIDLLNISISWVVYLICLYFTPYILNRISDYFIVSFFLAVIAPLSGLIGLGGFEFYPLLVTSIVFCFFVFFRYGRFFSSLMPVPKIPIFKFGRNFTFFVALVSVIFLLAWYFISDGIRYLNFDFAKVYEFREESAEVVNVGVLAYFNNWVYSIFSVFLMSYFIFRSKFFLFFIVFGVQIVFFGVSAHKSVFFFPFLVCAIWFYFRKSKALSIVPIGFSFIVFLCLLLYFIMGDIMAGSMFIRRVFYVPAYLTVKYFEFFHDNQYLYWSNSIFSSVNDYPYSLPLGLLIGDYVGSGASANNGFIASGYAHAGLIGVLIYSFILAYFLKILDVIVISSDVPVWLGLCMTIVPLRSALISSDLFTTLLTHGLLVSFLMLIFFRRSQKYKFINGKAPNNV